MTNKKEKEEKILAKGVKAAREGFLSSDDSMQELRKFVEGLDLPGEKRARFDELIRLAVRERMDEIIDTRIGRVFGATMVHL